MLPSRIFSALLVSIASLGLAQSVSAQVILQFGGGSGTPTANFNFSYNGTTITDTGYSSSFTGSFTDAEAGDSFTISATAFNGWTDTNAQANDSTASDLSTYVNGLTSVNVDGGTLGLGIVGGLSNNRVNDGEVLAFTFDLSGLDGKNLQLSDVTFYLYGGSERSSVALLDVSNNTITTSAYTADQATAVSTLAGPFTIENGDVLYVAGSTNADFRVSTMTLDIVAVPEPSAYAMIAGLVALGFLCTKRRRK